MSTITDVLEKSGRSGPLVFVNVRHDISRVRDGAPLITECQDIVYRDAPRPGEAAAVPRPAPVTAAWTREIHADEPMRFRYSVASFNRQPFRACSQPHDDGRSVYLWACDHEGWLTMDATATLG